MQGMHQSEGYVLSDDAHLQQSITDILTTPLGSRVMRRDYGSRLFELIDRPQNAQTLTELTTATAEALLRWEPRLTLVRVQIMSLGAGQLQLLLDGHYQGRQRQLQVSL